MQGAIWLVILLLLLPLAGMAYQSVGGLRDRRRFLGLGTLVDVGGGRRLYVAAMGAEDAEGPTVVFESGIAATSQNWMELQEAVSRFARTVSYDRGGLGWSSECASERTPANIVRELRTMLERLGAPPPYVLVGHSFGGLVVRRFAIDHPDEVMGVVLLDAMRTEEWPPESDVQAPMLARGVRLTEIAVPIARFGLARLATTSLLCRSGKASRFFSRAAGAGGAHVLDRVMCEVGKMPRAVWPIVAAHWSTPKFYRGLAAHVSAVPATVREMHGAAPIDEIPVLLLTAGSAEPLSAERLRRIGRETRQVIAEKSGHWVHLDEPELVLDAIRGMVEDARARMAESAMAEAEGNLAEV